MASVTFEIDGTAIEAEVGGGASFEFAMGVLYPDPGVATATVGTTTTLPAGSPATVTNSGDSHNMVLDFGIPQGPQGEQGIQGETGPQGIQGPQGVRGPKGDPVMYATVADMAADTSLKSGHICGTLGFETAGDGGAAYYVVRQTGTADGYDVVELANGLYAHLTVSIDERGVGSLRRIQTIETADVLYRKIDTDTTSGYEDCQGGVYYEVGRGRYYTYVTGGDTSRRFETADVESGQVVDTVSLPDGHYGTIGYMDGCLYFGNYTSTAATYGDIFVYDVSDPTAATLDSTKTFDTSMNVVGITPYKDGKVLLECSVSGETYVKDVYSLDLDTSKTELMFTFSQTVGGQRPQPGSYDPVYDCFVSITADNSSLAYWRMDGELLTVIHLRESYGFISMGELENVTPMGPDIYFAGYFLTHLTDATSIHLFHFNVETHIGRNDTIQEAFQTSVYIDVDATNGQLVPSVKSGENINILFPADASNIVEYFNRTGAREPVVRFYGSFTCGFYLDGVDCCVNTLGGYFQRGIYISDSKVTFLEARKAGFDSAASNPSALSTRLYGAVRSVPAVDKPCYMCIVNSVVHFNTYLGLAANRESDIYGIRLVDTVAQFHDTTALRNFACQMSRVVAPGKTMDYFTASDSYITTALLPCEKVELSNTRLVGRISGSLAAGTQKNISGLGNGELVFQILENSIRVFECSYTLTANISQARFTYEGITFDVDYADGTLTLPSNSSYSYTIGFR